MGFLSSLVKQCPMEKMTTMELGGNAQFLLEATDESMVTSALSWAITRGLSTTILGGGSNVIVSDRGISGLLLCMRQRGISMKKEGARMLVTAMAGQPWDDVVTFSIHHELAGLECLSGIPGSVGATPIQNVGAYGQEVADTIKEIRVLDRETLSVFSITKEDCNFGYRTSLFKKFPWKYVILSVTFSLKPQGVPTLKYPELERALTLKKHPKTLAGVRDMVLDLRRQKSMVIDPNDENRRSVGSFFLNPILPKEKVALLSQVALSQNIIKQAEEIPKYPAGEHHLKLSAAWLIEQSGLRKGQSFGSFGISSKHSLCLVHKGNGTSADLLKTVRYIQQTVKDHFHIWLHPEPQFLGFSKAELKDLHTDTEPSTEL